MLFYVYKVPFCPYRKLLHTLVDALSSLIVGGARMHVRAAATSVLATLSVPPHPLAELPVL